MKNSLHLTYTKAFTALLFFCALASSCKKLIEIPESKPNQLTAAEIFADSTNVMGAVAGIYNNFGVSDGGIGSQTSLYTGLSGDDLGAGGYINPDEAQFLNNSLIISNNYVAGIWSGSYKSLYQVKE
jgi:hypothetical protein